LRALHLAVAAVTGALALVGAAAVGAAVGAVVALLAVLGLHDQVAAASRQLAAGAAAGRRAVRVAVGAVVALLAVGHHAVAAERAQLAVRRALVVAARVRGPVVALLGRRDHEVAAGRTAGGGRAVEAAERQLERRGGGLALGLEHLHLVHVAV